MCVELKTEVELIRDALLKLIICGFRSDVMGNLIPYVSTLKGSGGGWGVEKGRRMEGSWVRWRG